jgi:hypothetical protein
VLAIAAIMLSATEGSLVVNKERIYREFLGIEPPKDFEEGGLK